MTPEGELFEGVGIQPDVLVSTSAEQLAKGKDPVLDEASRLLRAALAETTGDPVSTE
jgi:C-terminal processing protease CtpA/Prc